MFWHNFKYSIKTLYKNKMLLFWTFAFPLILGTFFKMAFSNIESSEKFDLINIAIVDDENYNDKEIFKNIFKNLSGDKDDALFNITYTNMDNAKELLDSKRITGYVYFDNTVHVTVNTNGINETILKSAVEEMNKYDYIVNDIISSQNSVNGMENLIGNIQEQTVNLIDKSNENMSYTMIEFYTLIAMACLYGGIIGMFVISNTLANISSKGKRLSISPIKKSSSIFSGLCASFLTQLIGLLLLFLYTIFILKIDYGENIYLVILLSVIGSLAGLTSGVTIGVLVGGSENARIGVLLAVTMLGCFFSGMMGITMKYIIDTNIPIINIINPANMITDGLYSLYYYESLDKYYFDIISLIIFSGVMILLSIKNLKRRQYDSL